MSASRTLLSLFISILLFSTASGLENLKSDEEFNQTLSWMYNSGITKYQSIENFRPYDNLTREQAAHFFVNYAQNAMNMQPNGESPEYQDTEKMDESLKNAVKNAYKMDLMKGNENIFRPKDKITRAEFFTVAVRTLKGSKNENTDPWWKKYFETAKQLDLTKETDVHTQDRPILRYEAGLILSRAKRKYQTGDNQKDFVPYQTENVIENLNQPWGITFLPETNDILVTEKKGNLLLIDSENYETQKIDGIPQVYSQGQGGLLDVALHPDFPEKNWIYLTYSHSNQQGSTTRLGRGILDTENAEINDFEVLFEAQPFVNSTSHYGSRIIFDKNNHLYMTVGDRASKDFGPDHHSQNTNNHLGSILRFNPDGSVPEDNPFIGKEGKDQIYSYGHRNPQGLTLQPETGKIRESEHGEKDGDEINIIQKSGNYGWPIADYGCRYGTNQQIGDKPHENPDTTNAVYYRECNSGGFPPAGMTFVSQNTFPQWQGNLLVGTLAGRHIGEFEIDGENVSKKSSLLEDRGHRIRDVKEHPETGEIFVLVDDSNAPLIKITPEK